MFNITRLLNHSDIFHIRILYTQIFGQRGTVNLFQPRETGHSVRWCVLNLPAQPYCGHS